MSKKQFAVIGCETKVGQNKWVGPVIATPQAIYCVLKSPSGNRAVAATILGGVVGGAVGGALVGALVGSGGPAKPSGDESVFGRIVRFDSLPEAWRTEMGRFPAYRADSDAPTAVIAPEDVVGVTRKSWLSSLIFINLKSEPPRVQIETSGFGINRTLRDFGWAIL